MAHKLSEDTKIINGLAPSADLFDSDPATDVVSMKHYDRLAFMLIGVATTGTAVVTVEECDNFTPSNSTAIAFSVRKNDAFATDTLGADVAVSAAGYTTPTSATFMHIIEVKGATLTDGFPNVRVVCTEGVDAAVIGTVVCLGSDAKYFGSTLPTAIA